MNNNAVKIVITIKTVIYRYGQKKDYNEHKNINR